MIEITVDTDFLQKKISQGVLEIHPSPYGPLGMAYSVVLTLKVISRTIRYLWLVVPLPLPPTNVIKDRLGSLLDYLGCAIGSPLSILKSRTYSP